MAKLNTANNPTIKVLWTIRTKRRVFVIWIKRVKWPRNIHIFNMLGIETNDKDL